MSGARRSLPAIAAALLASACALEVTPFEPSRLEGRVGLDFDVINGDGRPMTLLRHDGGYYVNQLRFQIRQDDFPVPEVVDWIASESELGDLDWHGLAQVSTETERARNGTYTKTSGYLSAAWMNEEPELELSFYDGDGKALAGPIPVRAGTYVHARRTAISWFEGMPSPGNYGTNKGSYGSLTVASGGDYTGAKNDIYNVIVTTAGPIGSGAAVSVESIRGDDADEYAVISGMPIALGSNGATITFTDAGSTELVEGDHWIVRCTAGEEPEVQAVEGGLKAVFSALAEVRLQFPHAHEVEPFTLPMTTTEARLTWSAKPGATYVIPITMEEQAEGQPGYGLRVDIKLSEPGNGRFYAPGEIINMAVEMYDGAGAMLHEPGWLPTYREYMTNQSNGIMYYRRGNDPSLGFFTENRLNLMRTAIYGPTQLVRQNYTTEEPDYYIHELNLPDIGSVVNAGAAPGSDAWDTPVANNGDFELPEDVVPGTYIALAKTARSYKGQSLYREAHITLQVGTEEPTEFVESVGNCEVCHTYDAKLDRLRHGISIASPKFCEPCHVPPNNEPVAVLIHRTHFYSPDYPVRKSGCSLCHLKRDSNTRASQAVCGACHGAIHPGDDLEFDEDPYAQCGQSCHKVLPEVHVIATTY